MKERLSAIVLVLFLAFSSPLISQDDPEGYAFQPAYEAGETWVISYQNQFSCRFQIFSRGAKTLEQQVKKVENLKFTRTFHAVEDGRPTEIEQFYIRANRRSKTGDAEQTTEQLPEQGARVHFRRNEDGGYELTETSRDLPEESRAHLKAKGLYELFLPEKRVSPGSDPWSPDEKNPLAVLFEMGTSGDNPTVRPELETFACELANLRRRDDRRIAVIDILIRTKGSRTGAPEKVFARIHGQLLYDLTRQKPVSLTLSSRPVGISFRRSLADGELRVNDMSVFVSLRYDTTGENVEPKSGGDAGNENGEAAAGAPDEASSTDDSADSGETEDDGTDE